ncbi:MAG TPA: hypothetical protein VHY34_01965 [Caulobacteraceae bacterium]|nr:hypothetical protein [Caulobacteraceae bacterium]
MVGSEPGDIENRLGALNERAKAEKEKALKAQATARAAEEDRAQKVRDVLPDWSGRISPLVVQAVHKANDTVRDTGIQLTHQVAPITSLGSGPPGRQAISITATNVLQRRAIEAARSANPRRGTRPLIPILSRLSISIDENAKIAFATDGVRISGRGPFYARDVNDDVIEAAITDFVLAVSES